MSIILADHAIVPDRAAAPGPALAHLTWDPTIFGADFASAVNAGLVDDGTTALAYDDMLADPEVDALVAAALRFLPADPIDGDAWEELFTFT